MLIKIVDLVVASDITMQKGTLFCRNCNTLDQDIIKFLEDNSILENSIPNTKSNNKIDLELSLAYLNKIGFYESLETFILKNLYLEHIEDYYIYDKKCYKNSYAAEIINYRLVLKFIDSIEKISKHSYKDIGVKKLLIVKEEKAIFIPLVYTENSLTLNQLGHQNIESLTEMFFSDKNTEKKLLFINELIDFLYPIDEKNRFEYLLSNFADYFANGVKSYQYYLSDFSVNKLKFELDSKALEFTQKIQSVINDSQTKLIAIPTAFILVFTSFDFNDLHKKENILAIISLFIFSLIIQLFLNNQFSILKFTELNILSYKETFKEGEIEKISDKFKLVKSELNKQKCRLYIVQIILWLLPISLLFIWVIFSNVKTLFVSFLRLVI